ncbi:uncharacterized protein LOC131073938 isoform X2 [Cryptomeria japonica]|uniref:uncharacterized protein LOC131073938 isoform X2 n=1 Tax=Cryptomeria japonica TaxID=3369 RepID=UPI0025AD991B|nr:uncharacterized protein LOC131073938 isoform X2 [Cryptomeria japonica]
MASLATKTTLGCVYSGNINQQENQYRLRKLLNFTSRQANMMACRVHVSLTHKQMECNFMVRQGNIREHKKRMKNVLSFPMRQVLVFGTVPDKLFRPSLKFNTFLQFNGSTLGTISSLLAYGLIISEVLNSFQLVSSGVYILAGYWVGPDFEDGWGYVEAAVVRVCYQ